MLVLKCNSAKTTRDTQEFARRALTRNCAPCFDECDALLTHKDQVTREVVEAHHIDNNRGKRVSQPSLTLEEEEKAFSDATQLRQRFTCLYPGFTCCAKFCSFSPHQIVPVAYILALLSNEILFASQRPSCELCVLFALLLQHAYPPARPTIHFVASNARASCQKAKQAGRLKTPAATLQSRDCACSI